MLYLFHGSDIHTTRTKTFAWIAAARAKAPDAYYARLDSDTLTEDTMLELLGTQGLFFSKTLLLLDDPFAKVASATIILENLRELSESQNAIALLVPKLLASHVKKIEPYATKVFKNDKSTSASRGFNSGLVNALGSKNGEVLWKEITLAYRQGDVPEMVHGLLHWKARDMMQKGSSVWKNNEARNH
jgi:2C-methyl-D-erythritol 2,4-cyclodiphosphate synthase